MLIVLHILFFSSDNLPVIKLQTWPLAADLFDSDIMKGPVPTLFADAPEEAEAAIRAGPIRAHSDLQRLMRCFFMAESLEPTAALKLLKSPRYYLELSGQSMSIY